MSRNGTPTGTSVVGCAATTSTLASERPRPPVRSCRTAYSDYAGPQVSAAQGEIPFDARGGGVRVEIVCLSPQPWAVDLPTNRQQLMRRAAALGHDVLFVETGPHLARALLGVTGRSRRAALRQITRGETVEPRIRVILARNLVPWGHGSDSRRVSTRCSQPARSGGRRGVGPPSCSGSTTPASPTPSARATSGSRCTTVSTTTPSSRGGDTRKRALVAAYDRRAAQRSRIVFATTASLRDRHAAVNDRTYLVPNVGDYAHFAPAADAGIAPAGLAVAG